MKLRTISAVGLKGPEFSHPLGDATAIIGRNAAGKTRILQAIRLVIGGYLPECGKTPKATWELSSGPELVVTAEFDYGSIYRRFYLEGTSVKTEAITNVNALRGMGKTESATGLLDLADLPLLNSEAYFELSEQKRVEYVFERIKLPDTYTPAAIIAECERISFGTEHSEQIQTAKGEVIIRVSQHFIGREAGTMQEGLAKAIEELREQFTQWNARSKATQGAVTTLAELKLREKTVAAAAQGDEGIEKAQAELDRVNTKKGEVTAKQEEATRTKGRLGQIREWLAKDRRDYTMEIQNLHHQIASAKSKLVEVVEGGRQRDTLREGEETLAGVEREVFKQTDIITKAKARLSELAELKCCPWCKSKSDGWQNNLEMELNASIFNATAAKTEGETFAAGLKRGLVTLRNDIAANEAAGTINRDLNSVVREAEAKIETLVAAKVNDEEQRSRWSTELAKLEQLPEEASLVVELETLEAELRVARQKLYELREAKDAETRLRQQLVSAAQAELEHQNAAAHVVVVKAVAKLLKEKRATMIEEAFGELLDTANKLTKGILRAPLALFEGTIGMWTGAKFVPHRTFSGTEKALAYIAIAVALSSTAPLKLVILDEFGRLDDANQSKVIERLTTCVATGVIDQYIIVGTSLPETTPIGMEVIRV